MIDESKSVLYEVNIYKPNKKTKNLEYKKTINQGEVFKKFQESLEKSGSHFATRKANFKSTGLKPHPKYKTRVKIVIKTSPDKWTPGAVKSKCQMCERTYYATNKRNTKFCGAKCGRDMSNEYKKKREQDERDRKKLIGSTI
jgi:hypothetical protein